MDPNDMRRKFDEALNVMLQNKRADNKAFLNTDEYNNRINDLKKSQINLQTKGSKKAVKDYRMVRKYDVVTIDGKERLIRPVNMYQQNILHYVTNEELFDILHRTHGSIGHAGRNRMITELKTQYCNITKESIMLYLRLCENCPKKSSCKKQILLTNPNFHSVFCSRGQLDLIDMQSQNYNDFRFIMVYQDHQTQFIILKPLKTKSAKEVACNLLEIYSTFGAPAILHSDKDGEFVDSVLRELHATWNVIKVVRGKARSSQDDGSQGRVNKEVEEILSTWIEKNKCKDWPHGLKFVQFQINQTVHSEMVRCPYEAMFGCPVRVGLLSVGIPHQIIASVNTEEDIEYMKTDPGEDTLNHSESENLSNAEPNLMHTPGTAETSTNPKEDDKCFFPRQDQTREERKRSRHGKISRKMDKLSTKKAVTAQGSP